MLPNRKKAEQHLSTVYSRLVEYGLVRESGIVMSTEKEAAFDPYHKWLGIPKAQRPPTHYQLLGLAQGETDGEVIEEAAIRQTTHLRAYQVGPHADDCTKLLNEVSTARQVLA